MSHSRRFSWMISPRGFIKLLGGEYELMQKAGGTVLLKFYLSSLMILCIAVFTFLSTWYAIELLFHVVPVEIGLSVFLSALFVLMYIFIINTFSKSIRKGGMLNFSNITRVGFVLFMGFMLSKPMEAYVYQERLAGDIEKYKQELIAGHISKIDRLFNKDLAKLQNEKQRYEALGHDNGFDPEINALSAAIDQLRNKRQRMISTSEERIRHTDYFIYRIRTVTSSYAPSWLICCGIILFFITPGLLIFSISTNEEYYRIKHDQEKEMISTAYAAFEEKYTALFRKYSPGLPFYTKYKDPPFNTVLKAGPGARTSDDFHNRYSIK